MTTEEFHRKLTAILSADVQGYSRLMGEDEDSTIRTLTSYRALMSALIHKHRGHVVDTPGDNLLAEFGSVLDAVRCAVEIQEELRIRNAELPENRKMQFRIGINMGDIVEEGDHIYGDGVNIAARVEGMAYGGGICISGTVYDAIRNKLSMSYEFMGEHVVKNIKELVRIYRIKVEPEAETAVVKDKKARLRTWQWAAIAVMGIIILGALAIWYFSFRQTPVVSDVVEGRKTIAVLPFVNMSSDPEQEHFVDGLSEELLNSLAQIPDLIVIARTSAFTFKGSKKKVQEIASELGVENILEGSVRKAGDSLRITAQLVKGVDGSHLWSKTYDRQLKDIFAIQEDIATAVASELKAALGIGKSLKLLGGTDNEKAYEFYLIAKSYQRTPPFDNRALESVDAAIELDSGFALAWALKSRIHQGLAISLNKDQMATELNEGLNAAKKAIELEPELPNGYSSLGAIESAVGKYVAAGFSYRRALELTTDSSLRSEVFIAPLYWCVGYLEKAKENIEEQLLNDPLNLNQRTYYIQGYAILGDLKQAKKEYERAKLLFDEGMLDNLNNIMTMVYLARGEEAAYKDLMTHGSLVGILNKYHESPKMAKEELLRRYVDEENLTQMDLDLLACFLAYSGEPKLALETIEKLMNVSPYHDYIAAIWFPVFHEVRQLPQFKEFVKEIGLVDYWNEFGWPDLCRPLDNGDFECD